MSTLAVDTITPKSSVGVTFSDYVIEQWRLTTSEGTSDAVVDNWERVDDATSSSINAGMTQSSGVFTFPSTGLWLVTVHLGIYLDGSDGSAGAYLQASSDSGNAYDTLGLIYEGGDSASNLSGGLACLINVTNASTFRFRLESDSLTSGSLIRGDTDRTRSSILFERKGNSQ